MPPPLLQQILLRRPRVRAAILAYSFLAAALGLLSPFFQKAFVDHLMGLSSFGEPLLLILAAASAALLSQGCHLMAAYRAMEESGRLQRELSDELYRKMLELRPDSLGNKTTGEIISLYATDVSGTTSIIEMTLPQGAAIVFPLLLAPFALSMLYSLPLGSTLTTMAVVILLNVALANRQSRFFLRFKQLAAERTGLVSEWVHHIRALKILGWIDAFERKIFAKRAEETANRVRMVTNGQWMNAISGSVAFVTNLVAVLSLVRHRGGEITPGELLSLLWVVGVFLSRPFRMLPWFFTFGFDAWTSARRVSAFLSLPQTPSRIERAAPASAHAIDVAGMRLSISGRELLREIDIRVSPGELVAIVGEVGSGKSLLLLSLMGETGAQFEHYSLCGQDALTKDADWVRGRFGFVPQEGFAISATLRENVAFRYDADDAEADLMLRSLKLAQFDVDGESLEHGLSTEIGERGLNLSGGQRQRVSIARAHFFDREIIALDDCLSALDVDTERKLTQGLFHGDWKGKTRILVTHRLTVLPQADRVIFMEDGRILEQGTFGELLARSERFRQFAATVIQKEKEEAQHERAEPALS